ncbi:hypothetical protein LU276_09760 [Moraxella haemolytica]|uniref:hypothetical protein n=1 Tax=Moraxella haemolytica TaxID=2904119 RepID=UPI002542A886|nr:hypothetical protein [Moraxella sp. ZY171148]WII95262.1 hypothetical protein LU276_09760 [Moraxella sp. ZY171148]
MNFKARTKSPPNQNSLTENRHSFSRCAGVQVCRCAGVQVCRCAGVQVCRCAGVQVCRCAGVHYSAFNQDINHNFTKQLLF